MREMARPACATGRSDLAGIPRNRAGSGRKATAAADFRRTPDAAVAGGDLRRTWKAAAAPDEGRRGRGTPTVAASAPTATARSSREPPSFPVQGPSGRARRTAVPAASASLLPRQIWGFATIKDSISSCRGGLCGRSHLLRPGLSPGQIPLQPQCGLSCAKEIRELVRKPGPSAAPSPISAGRRPTCTAVTTAISRPAGSVIGLSCLWPTIVRTSRSTSRPELDLLRRARQGTGRQARLRPVRHPHGRRAAHPQEPLESGAPPCVRPPESRARAPPSAGFAPDAQSEATSGHSQQFDEESAAAGQAQNLVLYSTRASWAGRTGGDGRRRAVPRGAGTGPSAGDADPAADDPVRRRCTSRGSTTRRATAIPVARGAGERRRQRAALVRRRGNSQNGVR